MHNFAVIVICALVMHKIQKVWCILKVFKWFINFDKNSFKGVWPTVWCTFKSSRLSSGVPTFCNKEWCALSLENFGSSPPSSYKSRFKILSFDLFMFNDWLKYSPSILLWNVLRKNRVNANTLLPWWTKLCSKFDVQKFEAKSRVFEFY